MKSDSTSLAPWQLDDAARLKALLAAREPKISQAEFGMQFDIGSQGMVWQYVAGRREASPAQSLCIPGQRYRRPAGRTSNRDGPSVFEEQPRPTTRAGKADPM